MKPFIDEAIISIQAGGGGNGRVSFRREKFIPRGGPNGGNGGRGGDVVLEATRDKTTLLDFKFQPRYQAGRGEHGKGKDMFGHQGEPLCLLVPVGTLVHDQAHDTLLADLSTHGQKLVVAKGGGGGRGNLSFVTSTNRAPRTATAGEPGEARSIKLELRLIADVGLIGLPNAGKSSFLRKVSAATPKVAGYPFTTLFPCLGMVAHKGQSFVVADMPGLLEGASQGVGLGDAFLRHVSRNRLLAHLVDVTPSVDDLALHVSVIRAEIRAYDPALLDREEVLVFTKVDLLGPDEANTKVRALRERFPRAFFISSHTGAGVEGLLDVIAHRSSQWALESSGPAVAPRDGSEDCLPSSPQVSGSTSASLLERRA